MTENNHANAEERHEDFENLVSTINTAKKAVLLAMLPVMIAGVGILVANNYEQKNLINEVSTLNDRLTDVTRKMDRMNEKVIVMWAGGEWSRKYPDSNKND